MNKEQNVENIHVSQHSSNEMLPAVQSVCIAWASRKRHIFVNGHLICETKHKPDYSRGGHYCSYTLSELPTHEKQADVDYPKGGGCHMDGIIPFKPLTEIGGISQRSICSKCLAKYVKLIAQHGR